jgi:methionyl-tRNA formyltransferase
VGAFVEVGEVRLGVQEARVVSGAGAAAGTLSTEGARPVLACSEGALELVVVQPPGRRPMRSEDYVRGLHGRGG